MHKEIKQYWITISVSASLSLSV